MVRAKPGKPVIGTEPFKNEGTERNSTNMNWEFRKIMILNRGTGALELPSSALPPEEGAVLAQKVPKAKVSTFSKKWTFWKKLNTFEQKNHVLKKVKKWVIFLKKWVWLLKKYLHNMKTFFQKHVLLTFFIFVILVIFTFFLNLHTKVIGTDLKILRMESKLRNKKYVNWRPREHVFGALETPHLRVIWPPFGALFRKSKNLGFWEF